MSLHIFEIKDASERMIRLTIERWKHIAQEHPEINSIEELKQTLLFPIIIKKSHYDPQSTVWYYRYLKERKQYLLVAVRYLNGNGFIITAYFTRTIK